MKFASTRLIAANIETMVSFYETVTGLPARWLAPVFAEIAPRWPRWRSAARRRCR